MFVLDVLKKMSSWYSRSLPGREGFFRALFTVGPCLLMIDFKITLTLEKLAFSTAIEQYQHYIL